MEGSTVASIYEPALYSLTSRLRALESKPVFSLKTISDDSRCHPALPGTDAVLLEVKAGWHRPFRMTASTSQEARPHTSVPAQEQTPYALYITERGLSAIQDHILSRIKARCHKTESGRNLRQLLSAATAGICRSAFTSSVAAMRSRAAWVTAAETARM